MGRLAALLRRLVGRAQTVPPPPRMQPQPPRRQAADAFTPTRPRAGRRRLVGRERELFSIVEAISMEGAHVVLYSERGRGKTSLANLAAENLRRAGLVVARTSCDAATDFDSMMRGLMRDIPASLFAAGDGVGDGATLLPQRSLQPADIADIPGALTCPRIVFLVDEFDRVTDLPTRTMLADTIKLLSDRGVPLHFMIVGVSTTLHHIIGQHPSIERNIMALHLPLLTEAEITDLLHKGGDAIGVTFSDPAIAAVAAVARGMPYMAQLMGLRMAQSVLARGALETAEADILAAIDRLLFEAPGDISGLYATLTTGPDGADMQRTLLDLAQAPQDGWGRIIQPHTVTATAVERLIEVGVLRRPPGAPSLLEPVDRRLNYHVLLLAVKDGQPSHVASRMDLRRAAN